MKEHHHEFDDLKEKIGIKYDDKKPRIAEMLLDMREPLLELCKVWEYGANKYTPDNWKRVPDAKTRYTNAMLRHLLAEEESLIDNESKLLHASHIVFNALARLYFTLQERQLKPSEHNTVTLPEGAFDIEMFNDAMLHPVGEKLKEQMGIKDAVKGPFSIYFGTREVGKVYDLHFAEQIQSLIDADEKSHIVDWKDNIADFYECAPQGIYNIGEG